MSSRVSRSGHWLRPAVPPLAGLALLFAYDLATGHAAHGGSMPVLAEAMPLAILAQAMVLLRIGRLVDLSLGAGVVLAAVLAACLPPAVGIALPLAVVAGIAAACLLGAATGALVHLLRAPAWVTSGLVLFAVAAAAALGAGFEPSARWAPLDWATPSLTLATITGQPTWPALPVSFWVALALLLLVPLKLSRTVMGNRILARGADPQLAERLGLPAMSTKLALFAGGGLMAGLAGALFPAPASLLQPMAPLALSAQALLAAVIGGAFGRDRRRAFLGASLAAILLVLAQRSFPLAAAPGASVLAGIAGLAMAALLWSRPPRTSVMAAA